MVMVPSVGAILSDYGADVVKVESLEGDLNRRGHLIPGMPDHAYEYCFLPDNRGKRSIAVDLKQADGRDVLLRLVESADVFLTNYRQKALERLGIDWEVMRERNPRLVFAHGTGFGDRGPEADRPGFDSVCYWSRSGLEATLFPIDGWLGPTGYGTGDHPSGMALLSGVLLALLAREKTGRGDRVTSSLLANGVWSNAVIVQGRLLDARFHDRRPREEAYNFTSVYYRAGDGRVFKITLVDLQGGYPRVCRAIGREDLIDDPRYATLEARSQPGRTRELIAICDEIFASRPISHWVRELEANDLPFSLISTYDEVVEDAQMKANDVFVELDDPELGQVRTVNSPMHLEQSRKVPARPAPRLGEHTRTVLAEIGLSEDEARDLVARRVVAALSGGGR